MVRLRGRNSNINNPNNNNTNTNKGAKKLFNYNVKNGEDESIIISDSDVDCSVSSSSSSSMSTTYSLILRSTDMTLETTTTPTTTSLETYRKGDWIYIEEDETRPYEIRKILDLTKTPDGSIQAKLGCVYRRSDISPSLLASFESEYADYYDYLKKSSPIGQSSSSSSSNYLGQLLKRLEVFYSNCIETEVPVECFRGKTHVRLLMKNIDTLDDLITENNNNNNKTNNKTTTTGTTKLSLSRRQSQNRLLNTTASTSATNLTTTTDITTDKYFYLGIYNPSAKTLQCAHKACDETLVSSSEAEEWPSDDLIGTIQNVKRSKIRKKRLSQTAKTKMTKGGRNPRSESPLRETRVKIRESNGGGFSMKSDRKSVLTKWMAKDKEKFEAGFNEFQRDFNKIQKKYLPHKTVSNVIEYYYVVWKTNPEQKSRIVEKQKLRGPVEYTGPKFTLPNSMTNGNNNNNNNNQNSTTIQCISCDESKMLSCFSHTTRTKTRTTKQQQQQQATKVKQLKSGALIATDESSANQHHVTHQAFPLAPVSKAALKKFENVCNSCWLFWKKHGLFRNGVDPNMPNQNVPIQRQDPDYRRGRIEALRYQVYKCTEDGCSLLHFSNRSKQQRHLRNLHGVEYIRRFVFRPSIALKLALANKANRPLIQRLARRPFDTSGLLTFNHLLKYQKLPPKTNETQNNKSPRHYQQRNSLRTVTPTGLQSPRHYQQRNSLRAVTLTGLQSPHNSFSRKKTPTLAANSNIVVGAISTRLQCENREARKQTSIVNLEQLVQRLADRLVRRSSSSTSMSLRSRSPQRITTESNMTTTMMSRKVKSSNQQCNSNSSSNNNHEEKENLMEESEDENNEASSSSRSDLISFCDAKISSIVTPSPSATSRSPSQVDCSPSPSPSIIILNSSSSPTTHKSCSQSNALKSQSSPNRLLFSSSLSSPPKGSPTILHTTPITTTMRKMGLRPSIIPIMSLRDKLKLSYKSAKDMKIYKSNLYRRQSLKVHPSLDPRRLNSTN